MILHKYIEETDILFKYDEGTCLIITPDDTKFYRSIEKYYSGRKFKYGFLLFYRFDVFKTPAIELSSKDTLCLDESLQFFYEHYHQFENNTQDRVLNIKNNLIEKLFSKFHYSHQEKIRLIFKFQDTIRRIINNEYRFNALYKQFEINLPFPLEDLKSGLPVIPYYDFDCYFDVNFLDFKKVKHWNMKGCYVNYTETCGELNEIQNLERICQKYINLEWIVLCVREPKLFLYESFYKTQVKLKSLGIELYHDINV